MKKLLTTLFAAILMSVPASAGIVITLDQPDQFGAPGDTLSFTGVISNDSLTDTVWLNADNFNFSMLGDSYDFLGHLENVPLYLDPNSATVSIQLFEIMLRNPIADVAGYYAGSWQLSGGEDDQAGLNLAQADFSVTVTPEPGTVGLVLAGLGVVWYRRRQAASR